MLKAAVDVFYAGERAKAVCVLFEDWTSEQMFSTHTAYIEQVSAYRPGEFYKRELPCILTVLQQVNLLLVDAILVDGYVFLDEERKGLGARLYEALNRRVAIVGVAKTKFAPAACIAVEVKRGKSARPLFVTAAGMDVKEAATALQSMAGRYRIPLLLRCLDRKTREE